MRRLDGQFDFEDEYISMYSFSLGAGIAVTHHADDDCGDPFDLHNGECCVCELTKALMAKVETVGGYDGRMLFDIVEDLLENSYEMQTVECRDCKKVAFVSVAPLGDEM